MMSASPDNSDSLGITPRNWKICSNCVRVALGETATLDGYVDSEHAVVPEGWWLSRGREQI